MVVGSKQFTIVEIHVPQATRVIERLLLIIEARQHHYTSKGGQKRSDIHTIVQSCLQRRQLLLPPSLICETTSG